MRKTLADHIDVVLDMKPLQAKLRRDEPGTEQVLAGAYAGIQPLLLDGGQSGGGDVLLIEDVDPAAVGIQLNVVQRRVEDDLLAGVREGQLGGVERRARRTDVVLLREGKDQRLRGDIHDRGLADRKTIGVAHARPNDKVGNIDISGLGDPGCGALYVGGRYPHGGAVAQRLIDGRE